MALPLLISKKEGQKICPNDYKLGWLIRDDEQTYWTIWGSSKDKEASLRCARDVVNRQGERDVYLSEIPLSEHLTKEQLLALKKITI
ncbi:MAG: hypothetical protein AB6733_12205 [Clostridiaceae bacterium]